MQTAIARVEPVAAPTTIPVIGQSGLDVIPAQPDSRPRAWLSEFLDGILFYGLVGLGVSLPVLGALYAWVFR